uniref:hypothetical protein n=1 Tax=Altererythrobacter segetis TaxID=1104773 RepID=UPI00140B52BE|nr:hypothetical protein [Altererythrobacter segetis]
MATTADSYSVKRAPVKAPISTHPAFPAIAALWFAALLGIGSLVLPVALIERFVSVTGLAAVLSAAAPPLGFTARAGIALAGAIVGALVGLVLARKVAEAHASVPGTRSFKFEDARQCRPILAHDELGEEGLGSEAAVGQANKRRTLAIVEEDLRSTYLQAVPLPGLSVDEPAAFAPPAEAPPPAEQSDAAEPLELAPFADPEDGDEDEDDGPPEMAANAALDALRSRIHVPVESLSDEDQPMTDRPDADSPAPFGQAPDAADPLPFAPPSLRRAEAAAFDGGEIDAELAEPSVPHLAIIEDAGEPESSDDRPLAELGLVQLAARLGASIARRKALQASRQPTLTAAIPPLAGAEDFEAAEADEAARAIADFFGHGKSADVSPAQAELAAPAAPAIPVPLQAWTLDSDDETEDERIAASFSLPLTKAAAPELAGDERSADMDELGEETEYSSLLAMKNPFTRQEEFVRVEEPVTESAVVEPTVTFPSLAPAEASGLAPRPFDPPRNAAKTAASVGAPLPSRDPGDAERNLRAALATLQRMSGAA